MKIAGSGSLPGGDYNEEIIISGSGKITGSASCTEFKISGSGKVAGDLRCSGQFGISGSGHINGSLLAPEVKVSGSGHWTARFRPANAMYPVPSTPVPWTATSCIQAVPFIPTVIFPARTLSFTVRFAAEVF